MSFLCTVQPDMSWDNTCQSRIKKHQQNGKILQFDPKIFHGLKRPEDYTFLATQTGSNNMLFQILFVCLVSSCQGGLLGAGTGEGSCSAPPFRAAAEEIKWSEGCPEWASCCTEYGYCQPRVGDKIVCALLITTVCYHWRCYVRLCVT